MRNLLPLLLLIVFFMSCNSGSQTETQETTETTEQPTTPETPAVATKTYPPVPKDTMLMLAEKCDFIDVVFYYESFSLSQQKKNDILGSLGHISNEPAPVPENCKPIGRIFYQVQGVNRMEADLFFTQGCTFLLFYKNNEPTYANNLTQDGISFYSNVFSQVKGGG